MDEEKSVKSKGIKSLTHFLFSQRRNKFSRTLLLIKIFFLKICSDICRQTFRAHFLNESATIVGLGLFLLFYRSFRSFP